MADDSEPPMRSIPPALNEPPATTNNQPAPKPPAPPTSFDPKDKYRGMDPAVALAQIDLEKKLVDQQISMQNESWVKEYWRPAAGWLYMLICFMDFVGFPLIMMFLPEITHRPGTAYQYVAWIPLTLSNGGMFHLAFGAILGVAAWTRGSEKVALINK